MVAEQTFCLAYRNVYSAGCFGTSLLDSICYRAEPTKGEAAPSLWAGLKVRDMLLLLPERPIGGGSEGNVSSRGGLGIACSEPCSICGMGNLTRQALETALQFDAFVFSATAAPHDAAKAPHR